MRRARTLLIVGGTMSQKLGNILLLPLVVATMSASEFTRFGLFTSVVAVAVPALTANLHMAIGRMYFDQPDDRSKGTAFLTNLVAGVAGLLSGGLLLILGAMLSGIEDPLTAGSLRLQLEILVCGLLLVLSQSGSIFARVRDRANLFALSSMCAGFGLLAGYLLFQPFISDKVEVLIYGYIFAQVIAWLATWPVYRYALAHGSLNFSHIRPAFAYASGTTIYVVSVWVVAQAGRWVGGVALPDSLAAGYTLVSYGMVVLGVLVNAYSESQRIPFMEAFSAGRLTAGLKIIRRVSFRNMILVVIAFVIALGALMMKEYILPGDYHLEIIWMIPAFIYCVSAVMFNRSFWIFGGLKETWWLAAITMSAAASYIVLVSFWISWGVPGLLWSSAVTMLVQSIVLTVVAELRVRRRRSLLEQGE
ncbi:hypothetical protein P7L68_22370 [Tistrella mobilis]|uniref:hypothetical protein n=1 Tax=Tistrella mobilis TaxID=171437 RepID=UPI00355725A1